MADEISEHVLRLRDDAAGWRKVDGPSADPDDPYLTGLEEQEAEDLVRSNWALQRSSVEEAREFYGADADADADDETVGDEDEAAEDVDEWENWNEEDWLDLDYQQRADDVEAGRVDDYLDEIEAAETSQTVVDAVGERRAELENEA